VTSNAKDQGNERKKLPIHRRLYRIGVCILLAGVIIGALITGNAAPENDDPLAYGADASVYAVTPYESKQYHYQLERVGGKSAVFAAELNDWLGSLWHGQRLGYTVAVISIVCAIGCFVFARLLSFQPGAENHDRKG
jgi:hypothetical protein